MAPNNKAPRSERTTRSSTRSQTQKSYTDDQSSTKPLKASSTGKIEKKRSSTAPKAKAKGAKKTVESKPERDTNNQPTAPSKDNHDSSSPSTSITNFTIDSELVKKPIVCHHYNSTTQEKPPEDPATFIFTHGAGGTLSAPAVVNFCTGFSSTSPTRLLAFQGSSNLSARVKAFQACHEHLRREAKGVVFGGRSMGARAAVMAATELLAERSYESTVRVVLVSYPLQGPKDVRDQILLDLPGGVEVLFIVGDRDAMCPLALLEEVRGKMRAKSRLVVVRGADHGMNVRPASRTKELGEETGRMAARWLSRNIESERETLYVGEEDTE
jgi:predicted alpha/beta-hydrolase family hydrolase